MKAHFLFVCVHVQCALLLHVQCALYNVIVVGEAVPM